MSRHSQFSLFHRHPVPAVLALLLVAALAWLAIAATPRPAASPQPSRMNMTPESMRLASEAWFAKYPPHGLRSTAAPVDSFVTMPTSFNEDNNTATQIDTARILVGDAVLFKFGTGVSHSVVSGTGALDPNMGKLFNQPLINATQNFAFTFTAPGVVPFFCSLHEAFNMKGVVIVSAPAGVGPAGSARAGFVASPWPNPARAAVECRFALAKAGRARLEVLDAQGRRVALVLDRDLPAGETPASWDGRGALGGRVPAGIYFMRLVLPDLTDTRRVAIER